MLERNINVLLIRLYHWTINLDTITYGGNWGAGGVGENNIEGDGSTFACCKLGWWPLWLSTKQKLKRLFCLILLSFQ